MEDMKISLEVQRSMFREIQSEINNINRILNDDNSRVKDDLILNLYRLLCNCL